MCIYVGVYAYMYFLIYCWCCKPRTVKRYSSAYLYRHTIKFKNLCLPIRSLALNNVFCQLVIGIYDKGDMKGSILTKLKRLVSCSFLLKKYSQETRTKVKEHTISNKQTKN